MSPNNLSKLTSFLPFWHYYKENRCIPPINMPTLEAIAEIYREELHPAPVRLYCNVCVEEMITTLFYQYERETGIRGLGSYIPIQSGGVSSGKIIEREGVEEINEKAELTQSQITSQNYDDNSYKTNEEAAASKEETSSESGLENAGQSPGKKAKTRIARNSNFTKPKPKRRKARPNGASGRVRRKATR